MTEFFKRALATLPGFSQMRRKSLQIEELHRELNRTESELATDRKRIADLRVQLEAERQQRRQIALDEFDASRGLNETICVAHVTRGRAASSDYKPWRHPFLTDRNIRRFRDYSSEVWRIARDHSAAHTEPLRCAFTGNLAQNMYKWAKIAGRSGAQPALFGTAMDDSAVSCPEWEEFDGEREDIFDGPGFLEANPSLSSTIPFFRIPISPESNELLSAFRLFCGGDRSPLLRMLSAAPEMRHEPFLTYRGFQSYWESAKALAPYDVVYGASVPFAAYFSGRPYCAFSVGGDLSWDCGRVDDWGRALTVAFNDARFLLASNPHTLGHSRRLGFTNGLYLPYPMDDATYSPGPGLARREWEARYGPGPFVLTTARIDERDKGFGAEFVSIVQAVIAKRPEVRFVFLSWGVNAQRLQETMRDAGLGANVVFLKPVGKKRLIDYYRSADIVLDQLVFGYYGATALEAASIGKPVLMKLRSEHYAPLYEGDVAPVRNVDTAEALIQAVLDYAENPHRVRQDGEVLRSWLVRNHGEERTGPLLVELLRLAADRVPLPDGLDNPLLDPLTDDEQAYHESCLKDL